jgi:TetR/AcrR family transcriptional regulator, transcriptional repressor for nem operon
MSKAAETRMMILQKAFELIYKNGYQSTSIDVIIASTKVTKGAFFYHFKNKDEMGLAVINEVMLPLMHQALINPLSNSTNPAKDIYSLVKNLLLENSFLEPRYGCPAGNLTQEMSPVNDEFSKALAQLTGQWQEAIQKSITLGKKAGNIRSAVQGKQVALFVMSGYWGVRNVGKLIDSKDCYVSFLKELKLYLSGLS